MLTSCLLTVPVHLLSWGQPDLEDGGSRSWGTQGTSGRLALSFTWSCRAQCFCRLRTENSGQVPSCPEWGYAGWHLRPGQFLSPRSWACKPCLRCGWRYRHEVICLFLSWGLKDTAPSCDWAYTGKYCPDLSPQEKDAESVWMPMSAPSLPSVLDAAARGWAWLHRAKPEAAVGAFLLLCKGNCLWRCRNHLLALEIHLPAFSHWAQGCMSIAGPPTKDEPVSQQAWVCQAQSCRDSGYLS